MFSGDAMTPPHAHPLRDRVKRALSPTPPRPTECLLPLEAARKYLEGHRLVLASAVGVEKAHAALVDLRSHLTSASSPSSPATPVAWSSPSGSSSSSDASPRPGAAAPRVPVAAPACRACEADDSYLLLDAAGGARVCAACGAVAEEALHLVPSYEEAPLYKPRLPRVDGVCRALVERLSAPLSETSLHFLADLRHWNQFVRLSDDALLGAARSMQGWRRGAHTRLCRVVAGLLLAEMGTALYSEEEIRACVRTRRPLPEVAPRVPDPTFPCPRCGVLRHDAKTARFHCRPYGKKRQAARVPRPG